MRRAHLILRRTRQLATGGLLTLWIVGTSTAAISHGDRASAHLLSTAFALTLVWFVLRFPRVVFGAALVGAVASGVFWARPRRRRG